MTVTISDYEKNTLKIKCTYFGIIMQTKFTSAGKKPVTH